MSHSSTTPARTSESAIGSIGGTGRMNSGSKLANDKERPLPPSPRHISSSVSGCKDQAEVNKADHIRDESCSYSSNAHGHNGACQMRAMNSAWHILQRVGEGKPRGPHQKARGEGSYSSKACGTIVARQICGTMPNTRKELARVKKAVHIRDKSRT